MPAKRAQPSGPAAGANGKSRRGPSATAAVMERDGLRVRLPALGAVCLPPAEHLFWYAGVAALAAFEVIEWPVALVVSVGKALADNRHSQALRELGDALEEGA
jgi:hypothetical protein